MTPKVNELLIIDLCSEENVGDTAMQLGLLDLVRKYFPESRLSGTTVFGANQVPFGEHFRELKMACEIELAGGLRPTYFPMSKSGRGLYTIELMNLFGVCVSLVFLAALVVNKRVARCLMPSEFRRSLDLVSRADFVIWRGRNLRERPPFLEPYRIFPVLLMPIVCLLFKKRMAFIGGSIWPLNDPFSTWILRRVLGRCDFVSVRESSSYEQVRRLFSKVKNPPPAVQAPDLAFGILRRLAKDRPDKTGPTLRVAMTIVDWPSFSAEIRARYKDAMCRLIGHCVSRHQAEVLLVPQVTKEWEDFHSLMGVILCDLSETDRAHVRVVEEQTDLASLVEIYRGCDYLVATRMHSAIFAICVGTPVVAIPYDKGGKWNILADMGIGPFMIPYDEISAERLIRTFESMIETSAETRRTIAAHVAARFSGVDANVEPVVRLLER